MAWKLAERPFELMEYVQIINFNRLNVYQAKKFFKTSQWNIRLLSTCDSVFEKLLNACEKMLLRNLCDGLKYRV